MVKTCEHCGSVLEDVPLFRGPVKQRLYEYIRKHPGCNIFNIMDSIYREDIDGGPETNVISSLLVQMKPTLEAAGLIIEVGRGPGATYRLVAIKEIS